MPGEELTVMPVALEHFAYQRKDLWVFSQSCGFSFTHTAPWLPSESDKLKSDKKPGPQRFTLFFFFPPLLKCWQRGTPVDPLFLQSRRKWEKAAQHDSMPRVKPSTCLKEQWRCLLRSGPHLACSVWGDGMLWMGVLLKLICSLVSKPSPASGPPSRFDLGRSM